MTLIVGTSWDPSLTGERTESYGVDILDMYEDYLFTLPYGPDNSIAAALTDGTVSYNLDTRIPTSCQLSMMCKPGTIDWMSYRMRPWVSVNDNRWNLGLFIPPSPDDVHSSDAIRVSVDGYDKTSLLDVDALDSILSIAADSPVVPWVEQIILDSTGESITGIVPSDKTLRQAMTWPAGTSKLDVVNALLGSIYYNNLWCDSDGLWRSEEWIDPADQAPSVVFAEGVSAIHTPNFTVSQNTAAVPNKVICTTSGDDSNPGLTSVATNEDPLSPYSYSRRGRWIAQTYSDVEAADQATLDKIAAKNLKLNMTPPYYLSVTHATVPLEGRQVLQFTSDGVDRQVSVNEWEVTMTPGSLMTGKWLAVAS